MTEPSELDKHRQAQEKEYGTYVAKEPIFYNGARAFNVGDPVPASHVDKGGWVDADQVVKVGTKAAEKVAEAVTTEKG